MDYGVNVGLFPAEIRMNQIDVEQLMEGDLFSHPVVGHPQIPWNDIGCIVMLFRFAFGIIAAIPLAIPLASMLYSYLILRKTHCGGLTRTSIINTSYRYELIC